MLSFIQQFLVCFPLLYTKFPWVLRASHFPTLMESEKAINALHLEDDLLMLCQFHPHPIGGVSDPPWMRYQSNSSKEAVKHDNRWSGANADIESSIWAQLQQEVVAQKKKKKKLLKVTMGISKNMRPSKEMYGYPLKKSQIKFPRLFSHLSC